jgi:hypothetical protein
VAIDNETLSSQWLSVYYKSAIVEHRVETLIIDVEAFLVLKGHLHKTHMLCRAEGHS